MTSFKQKITRFLNKKENVFHTQEKKLATETAFESVRISNLKEKDFKEAVKTSKN